MPSRVVAIRAALLAGLFACGTDPETPYVVLRIEDPTNVGVTATSLVLTDASGNANTFPTQSRVFPITVTLTSKRDGVQVVTVDLFEGSRRIARGTASINVLVQRGKEIAVSLSAVCFRYRPAGYNGDLDALNERVMVAVQKAGSSYISNARVNGTFALCGCVLNYRTTRRDMEILLEDTRAAAEQVTRG